MIVLCENCGKKYQIGLEMFKQDKINFKCRDCNHVNSVNKPPAEEEEFKVEDLPTDSQMESDQTSDVNSSLSVSPSTGGSSKLGIRGRMILLFVIVPVALMIIGGIIYLRQSNLLSNKITDKSEEIVTDMAVKIISDKGRAVADAVKVYLDAHPELTRENFNSDPKFKKIAVQAVGKTGYTVVIGCTPDAESCKIWAHPKDQLVGVDVFKAMAKKFGDGAKGFIDITKKGVKTQKESGGYYRFLDDRDKYMVQVPIEGTDLFLPSTTYIDEFTEPMVALKAEANNITNNIRNILIIIQVAIIVLVALIAFIYGNNLSGKIRNLTEVAEHVSVGELNREITVKSNDEIGTLADAIKRMQSSIRISMERLRRQMKG